MAARQQDFQTGVNVGGKRSKRLVIAVEAMYIDHEEPASCFRFGDRGNKRLCRGSARIRRGQHNILRRRVRRRKRGRCFRRGSGGGKPRRSRRGSRIRQHYRETRTKAKGQIVAANFLRGPSSGAWSSCQIIQLNVDDPIHVQHGTRDYINQLDPERAIERMY
ncbi:hypothetical protein E4U10_004321 [Claviceps purpurea]|nr:hypothetical protein E4U10_004321 [Claviceps purpurea]